jgi:hypothetical protein
LTVSSLIEIIEEDHITRGREGMRKVKRMEKRLRNVRRDVEGLVNVLLNSEHLEPYEYHAVMSELQHAKRELNNLIAEAAVLGAPDLRVL